MLSLMLRLSLLFFSLFFCTTTAVRADQITLFGRSFDKSVAIYGSVIVPPGPTERAGDNAKLEFYLKPSITLRKYSKKTSLVGYSIFAFLQDSEGFSFNNKMTFLVGVEVQHKLTKAVRLSFGTQIKAEREFSTGTFRSRPILTADLNLYHTWKPRWVRDRLPSGSKLVLSGWANYRYPGSLHTSEKHNGLVQGSFKLAADMPLGDTRLSLAPFASIKAKADQKGRSFNNILEPALGVDLKIPFQKSGNIAVGAKSVYQWRHATGTATTAILGYVTWYKKF